MSSDPNDHINKFIGQTDRQILAQNVLPCDGRQVTSVILQLMKMACCSSARNNLFRVLNPILSSPSSFLHLVCPSFLTMTCLSLTPLIKVYICGIGRHFLPDSTHFLGCYFFALTQHILKKSIILKGSIHLGNS